MGRWKNTYDPNGNRVTQTSVCDGVIKVDSVTLACQSTSVCVGTYDTQDRMLSYSTAHQLNCSMAQLL